MNCKHVFLVVSDSLRYDTARNEMSALNDLAAKGIDVKRCYAPGAGTPSSMPGIMQSRLPIEHGGYGLDLPPEPPTLAEQVAASNVTTLGLHSNVYTSAGAGFDRGFDTFADLGGFGSSNLEEGSNNEENPSEINKNWRLISRKLTDKIGIREVAEQAIEPFKRWGILESDPRADGSELFDTTLEWLDAQTGATCTWLQLMDTHLPYLPPAEYRPDHLSWRDAYDRWKALTSRADNLSEQEIVDLYDLYRGEARYIDDLIAEFVDELKRRGIWNETALVFTADHGELFNDRSVPGDAPMKHPSYLCEESNRVPLVIAGGAVDDKTITHPTSGVDIAPTIADLLDVESSEQWRGVRIGSDAHYDRETVVAAVSHTRGSGVSIDPEALHIAVRDSERELLWWKSHIPNEYYERTGEGVKEVEGGDEWTALESKAREIATLLDGVRDVGDVGGDVSQRLADLGYVER